ncbi:hypothetical protein TNCV_3787581 [Trichonephila clavipes]|nr:hypothetical protein TNCV_3787581 [Trichonephila clavipes]
MEVTRVEQRACIKIAVLRGRNAMECLSELVEALENNAPPYRTVARWLTETQTVSVTVPDEIGNGTEREDVALDGQINLEVDNDDVHRLLDTHNQELAIDELIEIHE